MTADSVIFLNAGHRSQVVSVRDIVSIDSDRNDVAVRLANGARLSPAPLMVRASIVKCADKLPSDLFFLAGRGCLVNLMQVARVNAATRNILLEMKDGRQVTISRKQSIRFRRELAL